MSGVHVPGLWRTFAVLIVIACMSGCTGGDSDLRQWVAQEKAKKGAPIPPLPVLKTFETFVYNDQDLARSVWPESRRATPGTSC